MQLNTQILAAANRVQVACTPKRNVTLRDEFGPFRGRPFGLDAFSADALEDIEPLTGRARTLAGRSRAALAFELAG